MEELCNLASPIFNPVLLEKRLLFLDDLVVVLLFLRKCIPTGAETVGNLTVCAE
jgi:hypothetical protein